MTMDELSKLDTAIFTIVGLMMVSGLLIYAYNTGPIQGGLPLLALLWTVTIYESGVVRMYKNSVTGFGDNSGGSE